MPRRRSSFSSISRIETADKRWDHLKAYQDEHLMKNVRAFSACLDLWHLVAQASQENPTSLLAFKEHARNAMLASPAEVRRWDIISWFVDVPDVIAKAVQDMQVFCHVEAELQNNYHGAEMRSQRANDHHRSCPANQPCQPDYQFAIADEKKLLFGFEKTEKKRNGFDSYVPLKVGQVAYPRALTTQAQIAHLRANFEVRKVRLAQAQAFTRFGFSDNSDPDEAWSNSLDGKMSAFIFDALKKCDKNRIRTAVLKDIGRHGNSSNVEAEAETRAKTLVDATSSVRNNMNVYLTVLRSREQRIVPLWEDISRAERERKVKGDDIPLVKAAMLARMMDELKTVLAEGVRVRKENVGLQCCKLVGIVEAKLGQVVTYHG